LSLGVAACGSSDSGGSGSTGSNTLTIYSSLPLQGDSRPQSESVVNGEKLALEEAGGKVGKFTIKYSSLDDSTAAAGKWEPGQVSSNARKAAQDKNTIVYLGEFNSGASAISIPVLNEAGILQISPSNTELGLTRPGGAPGTPDKYYPSGQRTFGRVVPADHIQGAAQATFQKEEGCTKTYVLNDKEVYGKGLSDSVRKAPRRRASRSWPTRASTRRRRTSAPWPRRSKALARTASSSAASRRTRACRCSRTSTP
jgi:branched-chain amino acid transport system substrate-binding protein